MKVFLTATPQLVEDRLTEYERRYTVYVPITVAAIPSGRSRKAIYLKGMRGTPHCQDKRSAFFWSFGVHWRGKVL